MGYILGTEISLLCSQGCHVFIFLASLIQMTYFIFISLSSLKYYPFIEPKFLKWKLSARFYQYNCVFSEMNAESMAVLCLM